MLAYFTGDTLVIEAEELQERNALVEFGRKGHKAGFVHAGSSDVLTVPGTTTLFMDVDGDD
jgi:hypothetical protein